MNIAIAGYGMEGKSNFRYFSQRGHAVAIIDERSMIDDLPSDVSVRLGENAFKNIDDFDMVIRTASMSPAKLRNAKKVWSTANEFFATCPAPIIGVTGTKGKGTTVSLIASILRKAGRKVHVVGNIGMPALDELANIGPSDIVVYELSSFQLWDIEKSPHIAVLLMIEPDHLDIHVSFQEYITAKQNITRFQTKNDIVVYAKENPTVNAIVADSEAVKVAVPSEDSAHVAKGYFWYGGEKLCSTEALKLPGAHNKDNACAAIAAAWEYTQSSSAIEAGLSDFTGLPHRLKYVRTVNGVQYYDDSIATTVGSAIAAIKAFSQPKVIILGGSSKGVVDFQEVAKIAASANVKRALVIGDQAPKIIEALQASGVAYDALGAQVTMSEIVRHAESSTESGDVVLLSPACASFGMFKNYADRGDQFISAVNAL